MKFGRNKRQANSEKMQNSKQYLTETLEIRYIVQLYNVDFWGYRTCYGLKATLKGEKL